MDRTTGAAPLTLGPLALGLLALGLLAGCQRDEAPAQKVRRPAPMLSAPGGVATASRPMWVRPPSIELPQAPAMDGQTLEELRQALLAPPAQRAALAADLEARLGAATVAAGLPQAARYHLYTSRYVEGEADGGPLGKFPYLAVLPEDYDPELPWPMHIDLHGGGRGGTHFTCLRHWGTEPGDFILLCPTTDRGHWWFEDGEETALAVVADARRHFNIDPSRVSLGGLSNGGNGTWHLGHKHPWLWSALIPRCAGRIRRFDFITNIMNLPTFMIHGDRDPTIPVDLSRQMEEQFKLRGKPFLYVEVPEGGHEYFPELNVQVEPWMLAQQRTWPARFEFVPTPGYDHGVIYWVEVQPASPMRAHIERTASGAQVTITTERSPERLVVYLNDHMADLDRPVTVVLNGQVRHQGKVHRSALMALETFDRTRDPLRTFTARVEVP